MIIGQRNLQARVCSEPDVIGFTLFGSRTLPCGASGLVLGCLLALSSIVLPTPVGAAGSALSIEDVVGAREFAAGSPPNFSPDGRWLAYTVVRSHHDMVDGAQSKVPWFARGADVYVTNLATNTEESITGGEHNNWGPVWSPDGRRLAFLSDRDRSGDAKLWIWNTESNRLVKVSDIPVKVGSIEWSREGRAILFSAIPAVLNSATPSPEQVTQSVRARNGAVRSYEWNSDSSLSVQGAKADPWSLGEYAAELILVGVDTGKTRSIIKGPIATYKLSPDGSHVAYTTAKRFEPVGSQQIVFDFSVLNIKTDERRVVVPDVLLAPDGSGFSWSPDSTRLCIRANERNSGGYSYLIANIAGEETLQISEPTQSVLSDRRLTPLWDDSGQQVYFLHDGKLWRGDVIRGQAEKVAQIAGRQIIQITARLHNELLVLDRNSTLVVTRDDEGKQDGVYAVNLSTGQSARVLEQGQCYTCVLDEESIAVSKNGEKIAFIAEDVAHSPELWMSDSGFKASRQVTHLNPQLDPRLMGSARLIDWLSDDGEQLKGALLLPSGYEPGKRYPLVVYIYGGSFLSNTFDRFGLASFSPLNMQILATRGYAVLLPDAPQHLGTPMLDLAKTILPGVNKTIELGIADPTQLAVVGHSYGGYSSLCLIVQTTRFRAAISIAGSADLLSLYSEMRDDGTAYGVALIEHGQGAMGGTPWDHRDTFIENSPFFYLDRVKTPLLIVQGSDDMAVAPFLGDQTFVALRRLGKEVAYAKYEGESHSPAQEWSYSNRVDLCYRIVRWLDSHLRSPSSR